MCVCGFAGATPQGHMLTPIQLANMCGFLKEQHGFWSPSCGLGVGEISGLPPKAFGLPPHGWPRCKDVLRKNMVSKAQAVRSGGMELKCLGQSPKAIGLPHTAGQVVTNSVEKHGFMEPWLRWEHFQEQTPKAIGLPPIRLVKL